VTEQRGFPSTPPESFTARSFNGPTVLVAEPDDESLSVLKTILVGKGYQVLQAFDGRQVVAIAETEKLDLVLLAYDLPRLSGVGVIDRLRGHQALENLPVVVMAQCDAEDYRQPAIAAGCDDFLLKPIDVDRLDAVLGYYVPLRAAA